MSRTSLDHFNCSLARTADILGDQWTLLILRDAFYGFKKFGQFQQRLGVAKTVLSNRLTKLADAGIMERHPPNTREAEYRLTDKGRDLFPILIALTQWGDRWIHMEEGPPVGMIDNKTGNSIQEISILSSENQRLTPSDVTFIPGPGANSETLQAFKAK